MLFTSTKLWTRDFEKVFGKSNLEKITVFKYSSLWGNTWGPHGPELIIGWDPLPFYAVSSPPFLYWARKFKLVRSPRIDSKKSILPAYVAWQAGTTTLFLPIDCLKIPAQYALLIAECHWSEAYTPYHSLAFSWDKRQREEPRSALHVH